MAWWIPAAMAAGGAAQGAASSRDQVALQQQQSLGAALMPPGEVGAASTAPPKMPVGEALAKTASAVPGKYDSKAPSADAEAGNQLSWGDALIAFSNLAKKTPMQPPSPNIGGLGNPAPARGGISGVVPQGRPVTAPGALGQYLA